MSFANVDQVTDFRRRLDELGRGARAELARGLQVERSTVTAWFRPDDPKPLLARWLPLIHAQLRKMERRQAS